MIINNRIRRLSLSALLGLGGLSIWPTPLALANTTNVNVGDNFFNPASVAIKVNDTVNWTWIGNSSHSSTSNTGLWDSGVVGKGSGFALQFTNTGTFPYHCQVHFGQNGSVIVQAPANVAPTVAITNPPNGSVFSTPATFVLAATASDIDGSVTNVQFFQGAASLGSVTISPYSVPVSNLATGSYTFSAVASDNGGLKATNTITLIVNALPSVAILSPTNGATFAAPWSGTIQATASDTDGTVSKVDFFAGITPLGSVATPGPNLSLPVTNLAVGNFTLTAVATDNRGGSTTSVGVPIQVVTPIQTVLSAPQRTSATSFRFNYTANPGLSYIVQRSTNLSTWTPISTNTAGSNSVIFVDPGATGSPGFYRVGRRPNP